MLGLEKVTNGEIILRTGYRTLIIMVHCVLQLQISDCFIFRRNLLFVFLLRRNNLNTQCYRFWDSCVIRNLAATWRMIRPFISLFFISHFYYLRAVSWKLDNYSACEQISCLCWTSRFVVVFTDVKHRILRYTLGCPSWFDLSCVIDKTLCIYNV